MFTKIINNVQLLFIEYLSSKGIICILSILQWHPFFKVKSFCHWLHESSLYLHDSESTFILNVKIVSRLVRMKVVGILITLLFVYKMFIFFTFPSYTSRNAALKVGQIAMPETCENWLCLMGSWNFLSIHKLQRCKLKLPCPPNPRTLLGTSLLSGALKSV